MSATSTVPTATDTTQTFEIRPFPGSVGAGIIDLDLARPVSDQDFLKIKQKQLNPQAAAMTGKLKFKPMDMGLAMKLGKLLT